MKNILLLVSLLFITNTSFGQGDAPPMLQGQNQLTKTVAPVISVPASQATKVTGGALIETGNKNLLANPSFEHATFNTGWTCTGITPIAETTVIPPSSGKKGMLLAASASTFECYQDVTASTYATSVQFLAAIRLKTAATGTTLKVCSRQAGTTSTTNCVYAIQGSQLQVQNVFNLLKVPFIGGDTSNGISIAGTSVTGNIYLDDAFMGPADLKVDLPKINTGTATYTPTTNCNWTNSGVSALTSTVDTDCPTPTVSGIASAPATKVPGIVLPAGTGPVIDFDISGYFRGDRATATNVGCAYDLYDGTNSYPLAFELVGGASGSQAISDARLGTRVVLPTALSSAKTYEVRIFANSATSICQIGNDGSLSGTGFQIAATSYGGNTAVYSTGANAYDYNWKSATPITSWTNTTGNASGWRRVGDSMEVWGYINLAGAPTGGQLNITVPGGYSIDTAKVSLTDNQRLGSARIYDASPQKWGPEGFATYNSPTTIKLFAPNDTTYNSTQQTITSPSTPITFAAGDQITYSFTVPIQGWDASPFLVGSFNGLEKCTNSFECEDTFTAHLSGTGVVSGENLDWINGNCSTGDNSNYSCTLNTANLGLTAPMNCFATDPDGNATPSWVRTFGATTSSVGFQNGRVNFGLNILCQKSSADYLGKTAKAVASDANSRVVGATGVEEFTVTYGTGNSTTNCSASPCSYLDQVGSVVSSITRTATGNYSLNMVKTYSKLKCTMNALSSAGTAMVPYNIGTGMTCSNCSSLAFGTVRSSTEGYLDSFGTLYCMGLP